MLRCKCTFLSTLLPLIAFALLICSIGAASGSAAPSRRYTAMDKITDKCGLTSQLVGSRLGDDAPTASLCINGALAVTDPNYNRVLVSSTGTGVGTGAPGNCSLSGSGTAVEYDIYSFNLTGCAAFPTQVTVQLCGPAGCLATNALDSVITLYRNVPAGDPLTANGGLPAVFNPASACTNARAANDDSGATPTSPGGSTCDQLNTSDCLPQCAAPASTANSEFKRTLGSGRFTLVIAGFGNATVGNYNLYVNAPAAGCVVALAPSAAGVSVSGRVLAADGRAVRNAMVTMTDPNGAVRNALTSAFGYYRFDDVEAGVNYVIGISSKTHQFTPRIVMVANELTDVDFTAESPK